MLETDVILKLSLLHVHCVCHIRVSYCKNLPVRKGFSFKFPSEIDKHL